MQTNIILNGPLRMFWDEMSDFNILFYTGVQLINNVVSVSGGTAKWFSYILHVPIHFQIIFPF